MLRAENRKLDVLLGERLFALRKQKGHSVLMAALAVGRSPQGYAKMERGRERITPADLLALSAVLSIPVSAFYSDLVDDR